MQFTPVSKLAALLLVASLLTSPPGVAATLDEDVKLYAQQPIMMDASLSPDGTQVAFMSSLEGRYHVVIERFKPKFSRYILYPGEELDFEWVKWANNDRLLVLSSYVAKRDYATNSSRLYIIENTETRLFSVGPLGQDLTAIIKPAKAKETGSRIARELAPPPWQGNIVDWLVDEPEHVLVALDSDINGADEVRRVDIRDGDYVNVVDDASRYFNWVSDGRGTIRIGYYVDADGDVLIKARSDEGDWDEVREHAYAVDNFIPFAFTNDPGIAYAQGRNEAGIEVIKTVNIATGEYVDTIFEDEKYDVDGLIISDSTQRPVAVTYTSDVTRALYFDETMKRLIRNVNAALPDRINAIVSTSRNHRQVLIRSFTDSDAGAYYLWDRDAKTLDFYENRFSKLGEGAFAPIEEVVYAARDGLEIHGYLTVPEGASRDNLPTIVLPHGGPRARSSKSYWYLSHFLAARGYAVFQPNFRGSSGYGTEFAEAGRGEWGGKMQDDVTDGARWLIEQGIADPERLCIVGWSYGGYAATMGAVKTPDLYQCAASINGVLDLPRLISNEKLTYSRAREWTRHIGLDGESSRSVSPYHQADAINIPLLIVQSEDDTVVDSGQSTSMVERMQRLDKEVDYVEIEAGGHSIDNVAGREKLLRALGAFIDKHIG